MFGELLPSIRLFRPRIGEIWDKFQRPSYAGIRDEKGFDGSRRNPNKIFPANVYPGPCFNSNYPTQLRPRNFFSSFYYSPSLSLSLSLSPSLSLSLITLGRRVRSLKFKYRESFPKNNVVPVVSWAKFHGGNSWYSFVTWPPPFHRIRLWLNFPAIIGENRDGSPFLSPPLPLILSFGGREKFGV